jgi:hypothetical protein
MDAGSLGLSLTVQLSSARWPMSWRLERDPEQECAALSTNGDRPGLSDLAVRGGGARL